MSLWGGVHVHVCIFDSVSVGLVGWRAHFSLRWSSLSLVRILWWWFGSLNQLLSLQLINLVQLFSLFAGSLRT